MPLKTIDACAPAGLEMMDSEGGCVYLDFTKEMHTTFSHGESPLTYICYPINSSVERITRYCVVLLEKTQNGPTKMDNISYELSKLSRLMEKNVKYIKNFNHILSKLCFRVLLKKVIQVSK